VASTEALPSATQGASAAQIMLGASLQQPEAQVGTAEVPTEGLKKSSAKKEEKVGVVTALSALCCPWQLMVTHE